MLSQKRALAVPTESNNHNNTMTISTNMMFTVALILFLVHNPPLVEVSGFSLPTTTKRRTTTKSVVFNTPLQYRNGNEDDTTKQYSSFLTTRWWGKNRMIPSSSSNSAKTEEEESSQRVDEYLKFLEKRYHQIHDDDDNDDDDNKDKGDHYDQISNKQNSFSVLKWLYKVDHNNDDYDSAENVRQRTNALFALNAAAQKIHDLQKNKEQQEAKEQQQKTQLIVDVDSTVQSAVLTLKQNRFVRILSKSRNALIRLEHQKVTQMAVAMFHAIQSIAKRIPKIPSTFLQWGGGKVPLRFGFSVLAVVLFHVFLPAISSLVKDSIAVQA